jgi:hypothetical protein
LRFVQIEDLPGGEKPSWTQDRLQSPSRFARKDGNCGSHLQRHIELQTQQREIITFSAISMQNMHRFLAGIELDTISASPFV